MKNYINQQFMILGVLLSFIPIVASSNQGNVILDCSSLNRTNQQLVVNLKDKTIVRLIGTVELNYEVTKFDEYKIFAVGKTSIIEKWKYLAKKNKKDISKLSVSIDINRVNGKTHYSLLDEQSDGISGIPKGFSLILEEMDWECKKTNMAF
jgi:hypothetical protein